MLSSIYWSTSSLFAQSNKITTAGQVLDSITFEPLPYTSIQINRMPSNEIAHSDGSFSIEANIGDSLVFTRLGYRPTTHIIDKTEKNLTIYLSEHTETLSNVTIYDRIALYGAEAWDLDIEPYKTVKFENTQLTQPMLGMWQIFGPGATIKFGFKGKEKKKYEEILKKADFYKIVNSGSVKKEVMTLFSISEEKYFEKLAAFNKQVPDAAYLTDRKEIVAALIQFFAIKETKH